MDKTEVKKEHTTEPHTLKAEEHTHSTMHHVHPQPKKGYIWQISAAVLAVLLVVSVFTGGFSFLKGSSKDEVGTKVKDFINTQLLDGSQRVDVTSVESKNGVYEVKVQLGTQSIDGYATKDGTLFFPQALPMDEPFKVADTAPAVEVDMAALADDDAVKGQANAPVTIIEFSDYECPFCGKFYAETLSQLYEKYIKTGKVKLIYRDFPLDFHPQAQKAAEAAECAGEQGKYYEMHNQLFEEGVVGGVTTFKRYAQDLKLNVGKFDDCLDSGKMAAEIQQDQADGAAVGVQGTPAFFVNGKFVSGAQPFSVFETMIEAELGE